MICQQRARSMHPEYVVAYMCCTIENNQVIYAAH
jgi:hypothetical protein